MSKTDGGTESVVLVVGATGIVGGMTARNLVGRGRRVRALVREGSDHGELEGAGAEIAMGDLKDPSSLSAALDGVDVVVTTANSAARGGDDNVDTVDLNGNKALVDAAAAAGVRQFVFTSALGAFVDHPLPFFDAKARTEQHLRASGMAYTIFQPTMFMEAWPGNIVGVPVQQGAPVTIVGEGLRRHAFISAVDVAAYLAAAVDHEAAMNREFAVGGPEALTWRDVVERFEAVLDRKIETKHVKPGEPLPGLPPVFAEMAAGTDTFDSDIDTSEAASLFAVKQTPIDDVIRRLVAVPVA